MNRSFWKNTLALLGFLACIALAAQVNPRAIKVREQSRLTASDIQEGVPPKIVLATTALGGFRAILIDIMWMRCQALKQDGQFHEMVQLYDWITNLQPHYAKVWEFAAWDLSYNVSVDVIPAERWYWVERGIKLLRDKGIPLNPRDPSLYDSLAWIYHHKIGADLDYGHPYYRTALAHEMDAVLGGPGERDLLERLVSSPDSEAELRAQPLVEGLITALKPFKLDPLADRAKLNKGGAGNLPQEAKAIMGGMQAQSAMESVRLFLTKRKLKEELHLDPTRMLALNTEFGPLDWRGPDAHSLYWSYLGREVLRDSWPAESRTKFMDMKYERNIYFSLQELARRGRVMMSKEGFVYNVPDYRYLEGMHKYLGKMLEDVKVKTDPKGESINYVGMQAAYQYFLERWIMTYYFNGQLPHAQRLLDELQEKYPGTEKYKKTLEGYVQADITEFISSVRKDHGIMMVQGFLRQYFFYLSTGAREEAVAQMAWAKEVYTYLQKRWDTNKTDKYDPKHESYEGYVPPLADLATDLLSDIITGTQANFTPSMIDSLLEELPPEDVKAAKQRSEFKQNQWMKQREAAQNKM